MNKFKKLNNYFKEIGVELTLEEFDTDKKEYLEENKTSSKKSMTMVEVVKEA